MPSRDALLIYIAAFLRCITVGAVGVFLAIFLTGRGYSVATTGLLIGVGLTGTTVMTALAGAVSDSIGRRRTLIVLTALSAFGYIGLAFIDELLPLLAVAFVCMVNGMGRDRGPAGALEQAMLPETTDASGRTWVLALYNLMLDTAHALGALAGAVPALLVARMGIGNTASYQLTLAACAGLVIVSAALYTLVTRRVEIERRPSADAEAAAVAPQSRAAVRRLALLFGVDSLGGGFLSSSLVAYWFLQRYGIGETQVATLFFAARVLNALSHLGAAWLSRRIGLLNTMVFTHLPSSILLMSAPLAPSAGLASLLFLCREGLVEMDVPTRQSYVLAIVPPSDRTYASTVTNVTRTAGWAAGSAIAGAVMQHVVLAGPLVLGSLLKIGYDVVLYRSFRHIKPPEETSTSNEPRGLQG